MGRGLELAKKADNQDLVEYAQDMRDRVIDLKENISEMRARISELEEQLKFKKELKHNGKCFEYEKKGKTFYICPGCEADGKISHMTFLPNRVGGDAVVCHKCYTKISLHEKPSTEQQVISKRREGWDGL